MFLNTLLMALRAIRQNLLRSALTILGIVIGTGSVAALVTIGEGAAAQVSQEIGSMGENLLTIRPGAGHRPGMSHSDSDPFSLDDAEAISREIGGVDHVAPSSGAPAVVIFGNSNWSTTLTGTTGAYLPCRGFEIKAGRTFTQAEEKGLKPVCILGATVVENLFDGAEPLGQRIRVKKMPCTVIGTLASKGENAMGMDQDDVILLPIRVFQRRVAGNDDVSSISVSVSENRSTSAVRADIESLFRQRRKLAQGAKDDFDVRDLAELASAIAQTTSVMTALLSAIAAVSLLVGGIGIMNIMLVSVTERTREIGIRMALGASRFEVRLQFLVEAAVLSGLGGIIGLIFGNLGAYVATRVMAMPFLPSIFIGVVAFVFSVAVGVVFGGIPAHRASKLDPMEALRHE